MRSGRRAAAAVAACLLLAGCGSGSDAPGADGPLATAGNSSDGAAPKPVGRPFGWGGTVLFVEEDAGEEPIVLDGVELTQDVEGLRFLGARVVRATTERTCCFSFAAGDWPPTEGAGQPLGPVAPVAGFEVTPGPDVRFGAEGSVGVNLVVGLELTRPGKYDIQQLRVNYHQGEKRYSEVLVSRFDVATK